MFVMFWAETDRRAQAFGHRVQRGKRQPTPGRSQLDGAMPAAMDFGGDSDLIYPPTAAGREHQRFEQSVSFILPAMERASEMLDDPESMVTGYHEGRGEVTLSYDDWFLLRGLLLCARFGACTERWPPWFNRVAKRHWLAWKSQGKLSPAEARRRFVAKVSELPGATDILRGSSLDACWTLICPLPGVPCAGFSLGGLVAVRFVQPLRAPTIEEAEAARRKKLMSKSAVGAAPGKPGTLESFIGHWKHVETRDMEEYLQAFGVGIFGRKAATAFVPEPFYHIQGDRLCISMTTPLGNRSEMLVPDGPPEKDTDPAGNNFTKTVLWEGEQLVSLFKSNEGLSDIITRRWLEDKGNDIWELYQVSCRTPIPFPLLARARETSPHCASSGVPYADYNS